MTLRERFDALAADPAPSTEALDAPWANPSGTADAYYFWLERSL